MSFLKDLGKIIGGKSKKKGAKRARKAGEQAMREVQRMLEGSTAQARMDAAPYREAGATALDAVMSMTGLGVTNFGSRVAERTAIDEARELDADRTTPEDYLQAFRGKLGKKGRKRMDQYMALNPYRSGYSDPQEYISAFASQLSNKGSRRFGKFQGRNPYIQGRALGGPMWQSATAFRNNPAWRGAPEQQLYNVNEAGPEDVYSGGAVTRNGEPQTIAPGDGYVAPPENPGGMEGAYSFQTDPGYEFRLGEGMRALERGAAARGGLLSGGYGRKAIRYGQDYASNEYQNVYNRIANIAGLGQVASGQAGNYALQGGFGQGDARATEGAYRASGFRAQGDAQAQITADMGAALSNPFKYLTGGGFW